MLRFLYQVKKDKMIPFFLSHSNWNIQLLPSFIFILFFVISFTNYLLFFKILSLINVFMQFNIFFWYQDEKLSCVFVEIWFLKLSRNGYTEFFTCIFKVSLPFYSPKINSSIIQKFYLKKYTRNSLQKSFTNLVSNKKIWSKTFLCHEIFKI